MVAPVVRRAVRALPRVLVGLSLVALVPATAACSGDPPRPAAAAGPGAAGAPGTEAAPEAVPATSEPAPTSAAPTTGAPTSAAPTPAAGLSSAGPARRYVFPVGATTGYQRTHALYPATDIFAACGSPVRAATDGVVVEVSRVDRFDPAHSEGSARGGLFVAIRGDDGVRYYGSHLSALEPSIDPGVRVRAGVFIGKVGHTGNASNICHLHFALSPSCGVGDWWTRRGVVWPWRYLDAWKGGQNLSPAPEVAAWQRAHGCPQTVPPGVT